MRTLIGVPLQAPFTGSVRVGRSSSLVQSFGAVLHCVVYKKEVIIRRFRNCCSSYTSGSDMDASYYRDYNYNGQPSNSSRPRTSLASYSAGAYGGGLPSFITGQQAIPSYQRPMGYYNIDNYQQQGGGLPGGTRYGPPTTPGPGIYRPSTADPFAGGSRPRLSSNNGQLPDVRRYAGTGVYSQPPISGTQLPTGGSSSRLRVSSNNGQVPLAQRYAGTGGNFQSSIASGLPPGPSGNIRQPSSVTGPLAHPTPTSDVREVKVTSKGQVSTNLQQKLENTKAIDRKKLLSQNGMWYVDYSKSKEIEAGKVKSAFETHLKTQFEKWIRGHGPNLGRYELHVTKLGRLWILVECV